jgi:hypothetical protein
MRVRVLHFDVFTSESGKGNPAGVVLAHQLDANAMQSKDFMATLLGFYKRRSEHTEIENRNRREASMGFVARQRVAADRREDATPAE